ncbi:alpha-amylase [Arachidicoccus ginsenosidimutans]|uniref:alpha-amylase family glycosyl hydrolase n=1 Tax=Arachidicoccus sp. BS20 TaxID=1850526 RepID=UPI0007F0CD0F|nr:alpha-amylase family glycosyl hydrolase [Arachidicoccus sp. BS20]ANI90751.1 alpha-amylase [Arachidicoccus sp. BS20]
MKNHFGKIFCALFIIVFMCSCSKKSVTPTQPAQPDSTTTAQDVPAGTADGVTFFSNGDSAIFNLYAPDKKSVYLIGDFNAWNTSATKMINSTDGNRWWVKIGGLDPAKTYTYQYYIDGALKVADPYSHEISDPNNDKYIPSSVYPHIPVYPSGQTGIVSVMQYNAPTYNWKTSNFQRADPKNLVVYELLVRDFVATHSYKTLTDTLDYIARLGVNAIELLPVNEFEGNDSWGYNSNFMLALDKYYGTPNDYKAFIDACHARGIAVIQDIVLEDQFGSSPLVQMYWNANTNTPTQNSPWFDSVTTHPYGVGYQLNYQKPATVTFAENVFHYWLKEYHIDGFRLDQANGYTQTNSNTNGNLWTAYDADRVKTLTTLNTYVKGIDPTAYMILEEFAEPSEVEALAQQGMISWNNQNPAGTQAAMSYNDAGGSWDLSSLFYNHFGIDQPNGLMGYVESHDEVRVQFKNGAYGNSSGSYSIKTLATGLQRDAMLATFLFSAPGPKMFWMFGERGYDDASAGPDYGNLNNTGDKRTDDQPPLWNYMSDANRAALYNVYAKMIHYKTNNPVFTTTDFTYSLNNAVKWIQLKGADGTNVEVVGNFDVVPQTTTINFPAVGTWYDNLLGGNINVASASYSITLQPGEYHVYSNSALQ